MTIEIQGELFDETSLPELANLANHYHAEAVEGLRTMARSAWYAGQALIAAKKQLNKHGEWLPWLDDNFHGSERTAQVYMRLAANTQSPADLDGMSIDAALKALRPADHDDKPDPVDQPLLPLDGAYRCIVIDPPWPITRIDRDERPNQRTALNYPVMELERIADEDWVPVRTHAADDCHIYLWVTHKFLPAGLELLNTWGFRYQCAMTWRKNVGITPFSWMYDTEHVLFGTRGNLPLQQLGLRLSFEAPVQGHSVKPDVFYERVMAASPGPRIDMFARRQRDGFDVWGNEVADVI